MTAMERELLQSATSSIEFFLNPTIFANDGLIGQISDRLAAGDLIVIRNAFQEPFAEKIFDCLDQFSNWKVYEGYEDHFHYHHHNIYDENLFPTELVRCRNLFGSESSRHFVQLLSKRDCTGETTLSASLYLPGDYSLPHNDFIMRNRNLRQVAFVWHLTKNWRADWGGEFFWCKRSRSIDPAFNTLLLFNVDRSSMHFVTMVAPHANGKRLAISGWWTSQAESAESDPPVNDLSGGEQQVQII
jgi:Rps23 Pro-64 3,4-dihydroxylase Tpa1-like proline 4-hydroxylase